MALFSTVISDVEVKWISLSFPDKLEKDFLEDYLNKSLTHTRVALLLAIFFYGIFGILDAWLVPEEKFSLWFIRFAVFIPYTLLIALFSYSKNFKKYLQPANASVVLLAGIGIIGMAINFTVAFIVSYLSDEPPLEVQELVDRIRMPA